MIIINASKIELTGNKEQDKIYYRHSNHPGGLKAVTAGELKRNNPERLLENSIKGMLPSSRLGEKQGKNYLYMVALNIHTLHNNQKTTSYVVN